MNTSRMRTFYSIDGVSANACGVFMPIFKTLNPASEVKSLIG